MDKIETKNPTTKNCCKEEPKKTNFWDCVKAHPFMTFLSVATITNGAVIITKILVDKIK